MIFCIHSSSVIHRMERKLTDERNALFLKLHLQSFLIAVFIQPRAKLCMNFMNGSHHIVDVSFHFFYIYHINIILKTT